MRLIKGSLAGLVLAGILAMIPAPGLIGQTTVHIAQAPVGRVQVPRVQLNLTPQHTVDLSNVRIAGFPSGPTQLPYPLVSTPANDAWARNNAWAAYNANLRHIPISENPNRLAARQNLLDEDRFIQRPQSSGRYNSSSATTRSGRFRQPFDDWGSLPVRPTEFSDLTRTERSKITKSRISCR